MSDRLSFSGNSVPGLHQSIAQCLHVSKFIFVCVVFCTAYSAPSYSQKEGATELVFTEDGAWCWFQDPRSVYIKGKRERTYAQWMTKNGKLQIGAFDHATGKTEVHTLKEQWDTDDHNVGAFIVLPDKRLMVFYARHNKQGIFCRTSSNQEDIANWDDEVTISDATRITYAHPVYLSDEKKYYLFWRGPSWKPTFATSDDGKLWSKPEILIQDTARDSGNIRPYLKIVSDGKSSIHFTFTDGHPNREAQNSVYYLKYEEGNFFKADNSLAGNMNALPVRPGKSDVVYDGKKTNIRAWVWDIALDNQNHPVIAYVRFPEEADHRYCYARWTGRKWLDVEITPGGKWFPQTPEGKIERETYYSGGMAIDHANPSTLYISRQINGIFEIEKWHSTDMGETWSSSPITISSEQMNVRPVVPRGYGAKEGHVLWMFGDYEHYKKYKTGIKLLNPMN